MTKLARAIHRFWYFMHCHCLGHVFTKTSVQRCPLPWHLLVVGSLTQDEKLLLSSCCGHTGIISQSNQMDIDWPKTSILLWTMGHTRWCCGESYTSFLWDFFFLKRRMFGYLRCLSSSLRKSLCDCINSPRKLWLGHGISRSPLDSRIILQHSPNKIWRLLPCFHCQKC